MFVMVYCPEHSRARGHENGHGRAHEHGCGNDCGYSSDCGSVIAKSEGGFFWKVKKHESDG